MLAEQVLLTTDNHLQRLTVLELVPLLLMGQSRAFPLVMSAPPAC
jgi:hypothetical protein